MVVPGLSWLMFAIVSMFYAYQYIFRVIPGIIMPEMISTFKITPDQFGEFCGVYYLSYTLMHIPIAILVDRYGVKKIVPIAILLTALGSIPLLYSNTWWIVILGRLLVGVASAASVLGGLKVIRLQFPEEKFSFLVGNFITIGLIAAMCTGKPLALLIKDYGWREVIWVIILFGGILASIAYIFLPKSNKDKSEELDANKANKINNEALPNTLFSDLKTVFSNYTILFICFLGGLMVGPLEGFADAWGTELFKVIYGFNAEDASLAPSIIFLGMAVGSPLLGYIVEKTKAYYELTLFCAVFLCLAFVMMLYGLGNIHIADILGFNLNFLHIVLFLIGLLSAYQIAVITKATLLVPINVSSIASATANMIVMIFGYVFHKYIGSMVSSNWDGKIENGLQIYSAETLTKSIASIPIALAIAIVGFICLIIKNKLCSKK